MSTTTEILAYDLGEDGDMWMIEGTTDFEAAWVALRALWDEQGVLDDYSTDAAAFSFTPASDWWWLPVSPEHPDEDRYLRGGEHPEGTETFTGVFVQTR